MTNDHNNRDSSNDSVQVYNFKGRFADYMRVLGRGTDDSFKQIFRDELYRGYAFCALYGLIKGRRHKYDPATDNPNGSEQLGFRWTSADGSGPYKYETLRKVIIIYNKDGRDLSERMDDALRYDYPTNGFDDPVLIEKSKYGENSLLIEQYVLGGLELIYEKVSEISSKEEMVRFIMDVRAEFNEALGIKE